jgi:aspartyl/asparaginyl beta-hydroxylase (cupin superfamily)
MVAEDEIRDLLGRGTGYAGSGDRRAAASFFMAALRAAGGAGSLPTPLLSDLRAAEDYVRETAAAYQACLDRAVAEADAGPRLQEAMAIMLGRRPMPPVAARWPQQPSAFYFPGLPQRAFYEREEFPWVGGLEAETAAIRAELEALLQEGADFRPYVEAEKDRPGRDFHGLNDSPDWTAFYLWKDGTLLPDNAVRCPRTVAAMARVPLSGIGSRTPSVLFSLLRPGAHIPSHHGMLNSRLICHLPLIVPPGCWFRVGGETRAWEEGKTLIFDDSISHEAKNGSDRLRVVLLFDIWRPELSEAERRGLAAIFDAIDGFGRTPATAAAPA